EKPVGRSGPWWSKSPPGGRGGPDSAVRKSGNTPDGRTRSSNASAPSGRWDGMGMRSLSPRVRAAVTGNGECPYCLTYPIPGEGKVREPARPTVPFHRVTGPRPTRRTGEVGAHPFPFTTPGGRSRVCPLRVQPPEEAPRRRRPDRHRRGRRDGRRRGVGRGDRLAAGRIERRAEHVDAANGAGLPAVAAGGVTTRKWVATAVEPGPLGVRRSSRLSRPGRNAGRAVRGAGELVRRNSRDRNIGTDSGF